MDLRRIGAIIILFSIIIQFCIISIATEEQVEEIVVEENAEEQVDDIEEEGMKIYSEAAILIEEQTGKILYEKNCHERKYPASTTKILTAIIALEKCDLKETAKASYYAVNSLKDGYTKADIQVGEEFTIEELLDVMMLQSANEAATIIAEHISGSVSEFSKLMNKKAKEIGCLDSNFVNPNGMHDENHYSTAYDLAMIARYCMRNDKFRELVVKMECSLPHTEYWQEEQVEEHGERNFKNTNNLLIPDNKFYYPYAIGIKSGFTTPAKNCLISASNKDGFETVAVILHAEQTEDGVSARYIDTINLFEYGYNNYNLEDILKENNVVDNYIENDKPKEILEEKMTEKIPIEIEEVQEKIKLDGEILKIIIGIALIIFAIIIIFTKGKKGKNGKEEDLYKFKLN